MNHSLPYSDDERIEAFARALGIALRRILDSQQNENSARPDDLPVPANPKPIATGDPYEH
jgi:hypothetical protein